MNNSNNNQRFRLFKKLVLSNLFILAGELELFCAKRKLKVRVKNLRDQWADLGVTIENELGESGGITRYTYLQIEDFIIELNGLSKSLLDSGLHQWANKAFLAMNVLDEILRRNSNLFLSTEQSLQQSGYIKYPYDDYSPYYHDGVGIRTSFDKVLVHLTEDGLIIKNPKKRYKNMRMKSKIKNDVY